MTHRRIDPAGRPVDVEFHAVPSKSDTHRALVAAALASGRSEIVGPLDAGDTRRTRAGLSALGFTIADGDGSWSVDGCGGRVPGGGVIDCGPSGTTCRLLAAVAALGEARSSLDGDLRLRERPLEPLVGALASLGASIAADSCRGGLPLTAGGRAFPGGAVSVTASSTSQFASALLMIGPCLPGGLRLRLVPPVVSRPYLDLTVRTMRAFGATVAASPDGLLFGVAPSAYQPKRHVVEGDWSAASYWLVLPALLGGRVRLLGLSAGSAQPDARIARLLAESGLSVRHDDDGVEVEGGPGLRAFDIDASECPDLVPTLAVVALVADGRCRMRGVGHLRLKESDRLAQLERNLARLGATVSAERDVLEVDGRDWRPAACVVETAADHRIAMAFAAVGLCGGGLVIDDVECVAKSNPGFWSDLARIERGVAPRQNW